MSLPPAPAPFTDADYEMIASAVLETARGRWFLAEHARRNRHADTRLVLEAIARLERAMGAAPNAAGPERVRLDLVDMMSAIRRTKAEIAAIRPSRSSGRIVEASNELDAIVEMTQTATSDILAVAERVQEIAWAMREQGIDSSVCDLIDTHMASIFTGCSFQDLTGQRIRKVVQVLRFIEERLDAMIKIWRLDDLELVPMPEERAEAPRLGDPPPADPAQLQAAVDDLMGNRPARQDVVWHDVDMPRGRRPHHLSDFDLDDVTVIEAAPIGEPEPEPAPAPAYAPAPSVAPAASAVREDDANTPNDVETLSPIARLALFS